MKNEQEKMHIPDGVDITTEDGTSTYKKVLVSLAILVVGIIIGVVLAYGMFLKDDNSNNTPTEELPTVERAPEKDTDTTDDQPQTNTQESDLIEDQPTDIFIEGSNQLIKPSDDSIELTELLEDVENNIEDPQTEEDTPPGEDLLDTSVRSEQSWPPVKDTSEL